MNITGVINIKKAIVHVLNQKEKHIMSDYDIELNDRLNSLIVKHIDKSNVSEAKVFAKFNNEDNNTIRKSCLNIFNNETIFIEESKNISRELYKAMTGTNASAANLLIVYFTHGSKKALAIMKLDFSDNFYTEHEIIGGKMKINVKINGTGFSDSQKLRKCAIINEDTMTIGDKEFLLLDTQSGDVSDYFRIGFLNSDLINDSKNNTKKVIKEINKYINKKFEDNPKEMVKKTFLFTNIIENNTEFKIDTVLNSLFEEKDTIDEVKGIISNEKIDFNFKIDKNTSEKKFKNVTIVSENGISLKAKSSLFNEQDIVLSDPDSDGKVDITLKGIKIDKNKIG
ncbi:MAG: nucleoid-associated protein [Clostridium baratii]